MLAPRMDETFPDDTHSDDGFSSATEPTAADLLAEADRLYHAKAYQESLPRYEKSAALARSEFNRSVEAEATAQIARNYISLGKIDDGRSFLERATQLSSPGDPYAFSRLLSVRGRFEWKDGQRETAGQTFQEMLSYCQEHALAGRGADAANMLGILSLDFDEQIRWFSRGITLLEAQADQRLLAPLLNNLAAAYYDAEQYPSALGYYLQAREQHWHHGTEREKLFADLYVGMAYRALGRGRDARRWLRPVLAWAERLDDAAILGQTAEELARVALAEQQTTEARDYLLLAIAHYERAGLRQQDAGLLADLEQQLAGLPGTSFPGKGSHP